MARRMIVTCDRCKEEYEEASTYDDRTYLLFCSSVRDLCPDCYDAEHLVVARYQACARRLLDMFPGDPLPAECKAQAYVERLEALLDKQLIGPHVAAK